MTKKNDKNLKSKNKTAVYIDKEIKNLASVKAKSQSMSVSTVANILLQNYAKGKIKIENYPIERDENGFTKEASNRLDKIIAESEKSENLSPSFQNIDDALDYLHQ